MSTITFEEYKEGIKLHFQAIKTEGCYGSGDLSNVTPAQLRELCLRKAENHLSSKDEMIFNYFFNVKEGEKLERVIANYEIGKFKSVISFLKGEKNSENRNRIELAAIIIDFTPRPFNNYFSCHSQDKIIPETTQSEKAVTKNIEHNPSVVAAGFNLEANKKTVSNSKFGKLLTTIVAFCGMGVGFITLLPNKECMQWNNTHYEIVDCSGQNQGYLDTRIPINKDRLTLKMLKATETTKYFENGTPKVWYSKNEGKIELYNQPGLHPATGKTLKPITRYIIKKYLSQKSK